MGETESVKSGEDEEDGVPLPGVPEFEFPQEVKKMAQNNKNETELYLEAKPIFRKTSSI